MDLINFRRMQSRVSRAKRAVATNDVTGFRKALCTSSNVGLVVVGIKSPEQLEDELLQLCVWIWSMKDYLKNLANANGATGQQIEDIVNASDALAIVADIANRDKHGLLTKSRTGDFAKLTDVGYKINLTALTSLAFRQMEMEIDVAKPNDAELYASIDFESGNRAPLDAFPVIDAAISAWENHAYPLAGA